MPTVLEAALQLILIKGWIKGHLHTTYGYCAVGAINAVCWNRHSSTIVPMSLLSKVTNTPYIADWNDAPERTKEDVIAAFRKAIENEHNTNT